MPQVSPARARLTPAHRAALDAGEHEALAQELREADPELAGWIWERIWDFDRAREAYLRAGLPLEALRCALDATETSGVVVVLDAIERLTDGGHALEHPSATEHPIDPRVDLGALRSAAARMLEGRGRRSEAAQLLSAESGREDERVELLRRDGDLIGAAQLLQERGESQRALAVLGALREGPGAAPRIAMASRLEWELGDAEGCARHAQAALRCAGDGDGALRSACERLLVGALQALGHAVAAEIVLARRSESEPSEALGAGQELRLTPMRGRFHVTGSVHEPWIGAAYLAIDRLSLASVEVHLLLADLTSADRVSGETQASLAQFARSVRASQTVGHAAIRSVLYLDEDAGVMVLPRAEGPSAAAWIRAGLMQGRRLAVRAAVRFLMEGLARAHAVGAVHGGIVPSTVSTDALGRLVLGPFGGHALSGLMATRTGSLEELLRYTAPELRAAQVAASEAGDVFAVGVLWQSLLVGAAPDPQAIQALAREEVVLASFLDPDPAARPQASQAYEMLASPVADLTDIAQLDPMRRKPTRGAEASSQTLVGKMTSQASTLMPAITMRPHESIPSQWLAELGALSPGFVQAVLDRDALDPHAPWTLASSVVPPSAPASYSSTSREPPPVDASFPSWAYTLWPPWLDLLTRVSPGLRSFLVAQVQPADWQRLDQAAHMLCLEGPLSRPWIVAPSTEP